jgi:hypothetical protein
MKTTAPKEPISKTSAASRAVRHYLCQQAVISGVSNAVLNSLFFYLLHRDMGAIAYGSVFMDTLITCGFVAGLVTWPTSHFTRKAVKAGLPLLEKNRLIDSLPKPWPLLWLVLWLVSAFAMELLLWLSFTACGLNEISFLPMLAVKFVSMGSLGGVLGALVAARYLQPGAFGSSCHSRLTSSPLSGRGLR